MAEAFVNAEYGNRLRAYSAGREAGQLNPTVVEAMRELDIDISGNRTKSVNDAEIRARAYDYVVTVCDQSSAEACPIVPTLGTRLHWSFPDPSAFAGTPDACLDRARDVRDAIRERVDAWCAALSSQHIAVNTGPPSDATGETVLNGPSTRKKCAAAVGFLGIASPTTGFAQCFETQRRYDRYEAEQGVKIQ